MNKNSKYLLLLALSIFSSAAMAIDDYRQDSGLVGPSHYAKNKTSQENPDVKALQVIQEKHKDTLKTDVKLKELDDYFSDPAEDTGFTREIFAAFKGTKGESPVIASAQQKLPDDKLLAVHKFQGDKTVEGIPVQITQNATLDSKGTQKHEATTTVVAEKSGFKITFKQTLDLLNGGKPIISLTEEEIKDEGSSQPAVINGVLHVAIYSDKEDIPTTTGPTSAIRQIFNLPQ